MTRYDGKERPVPILDALYPYAGPCGFCGFGDKRHRLADAVVDYPGEPQAAVDAYDWPGVVTAESVLTLRAYSEQSRRRHRHRWEIR